MISRRIILLVIVAAVVSVGVAYQLLRPREGVDIRLILAHGFPQKITIELKCTGNQPAYIYKIIFLSFQAHLNYTFAEDIVVPPGSEVRITFPSQGGDVILEMLSGEAATGGGVAILEGDFMTAAEEVWDWVWDPEWGPGNYYPTTGSTTVCIPVVLTRAGNEYRHTAAFQREEYVPE